MIYFTDVFIEINIILKHFIDRWLHRSIEERWTLKKICVWSKWKWWNLCHTFAEILDRFYWTIYSLSALLYNNSRKTCCVREFQLHLTANFKILAKPISMVARTILRRRFKDVTWYACTYCMLSFCDMVNHPFFFLIMRNMYTGRNEYSYTLKYGF